MRCLSALAFLGFVAVVHGSEVSSHQESYFSDHGFENNDNENIENPENEEQELNHTEGEENLLNNEDVVMLSEQQEEEEIPQLSNEQIEEFKEAVVSAVSEEAEMLEENGIDITEAIRSAQESLENPQTKPLGDKMKNAITTFFTDVYKFFKPGFNAIKRHMTVDSARKAKNQIVHSSKKAYRKVKPVAAAAVAKVKAGWNGLRGMISGKKNEEEEEDTGYLNNEDVMREHNEELDENEENLSESEQHIDESEQHEQTEQTEQSGENEGVSESEPQYSNAHEEGEEIFPRENEEHENEGNDEEMEDNEEHPNFQESPVDEENPIYEGSPMDFPHTEADPFSLPEQSNDQ